MMKQEEKDRIQQQKTATEPSERSVNKPQNLRKTLSRWGDVLARTARKRTVELRAALRQPPVWKRVKTVCIVMLVFANVVLLGVSAVAKLQNDVLKRQSYDQIDTKLAQNGVLCGGSVYRALEEYPQAYTLRMDKDAQDSLARALLTGNVREGADTANTTVWSGDNGVLRWTASGDVEGDITLNTVPEPQEREEAQKIIRNLLKKAGIDTKDSQYTTTRQETEYIVEVRQYVNGIELVGNKLVFTIAEGNDTTVSGKWCIGNMQPLSVRVLENYSAEQSVFRLLAAQPTVTQIISVQPAYILSDKSGGRFTTIPCWRFSADNGDYIMNILSGEVVASTDIEAIASQETNSAPNDEESFGVASDSNTDETNGTDSTQTSDAIGAETDQTTGTSGNTSGSTNSNSGTGTTQDTPDVSWDE